MLSSNTASPCTGQSRAPCWSRFPGAEFVVSVREHVRQWPAWVTSSRDWRPAQAYAILTLCRALYGVVHGEQVSKLRAARWVQGYAPAWAGLMADALQWRQNWRAE